MFFEPNKKASQQWGSSLFNHLWI